MHPIVNIASQAAIKAGELMRRELVNLDRIPVARKARNDYVTEVDQACEALIVKEIHRFHPDHAILGEEGGKQGDSEHVWIIDPLDGTTNFLHRIPHFAVSIAVQENGRTEHAVVYDPMREEMFSATRGKGTYMNNTRLRVSERTELDSAVLGTAFPFRERQLMPIYTRLFSSIYRKTEDVRRSGSAALDFAWVAAGRLDGFYELGLKPWDVAAGAMLVREAGGVVVDFQGNDAVEDAGSVLAAPYKLMTPLRQIIEPQWKTHLASAKSDA